MAEQTAHADAPAEAAKGGGKGKLFLIVGVVLLLAGGGGAAWFLGFIGHGHSGSAEGEAEAKEEAPAVHSTGKGEVGAMQPLETFIANLSDEDGKRYLKATLQVEFFDARVPDDFAARTAQIRDLLLTLFTSKTFSDVRTPEGKGQLREEIINRMNRALHRDAVKAVYFTEFIVQ
jgi:flagellar FliL protein